jgi:nucleoid-associated protein YgaU
LQQENAALNARLRQAQAALDQIAAAARQSASPASNAAAPVAPSPARIATVASPPPPTGIAASPVDSRVHVVADGDSLTRISLRYYGTASRWPEIYQANRDLLRTENVLHVGQRLIIP